MFNFLNKIGIVFAIVPAIFELVKSFEVPGFGEAKKNLIINLIKIFWPTLQESIKELRPVTWEIMEAIVDQVIELVVTFLNTVGIFKHSEG